MQELVPVVDSQNNPLQPCKCSVARRLVKIGRATPFFKKGIFTIRLNKRVPNPTLSKVVVAIDPGSKRTGITVSTEKKVIFNIQCNTPDWTKKKIETKRMYRRSRRQKKTPYRKCRFNRKIGGLPPSTKARWQAHLRVIDVLRKILNVVDIVIEDIKARTIKNGRRWNKNFSPLEVGKKWFQEQVISRGLNLFKFQGFNTKDQREKRDFKKLSNKLSNKWEAHCVDSHCLVELYLKKELEPTKFMYLLNFLKFNRRELHQGFKKGGIRRKYGSTRSEGLNRGSLVKHIKCGLTYIGGTSKNLISLHNIKTGKRICQNAKTSECKVLTNNKWRLILSWS